MTSGLQGFRTGEGDMGARISLIAGFLAVAAWWYLILVRHIPAGWPHVLYAAGMMLIIRGIALRDQDREVLKP
jgi:hypothetical protein